MTNRPDVAILLDHFGSGGVERVACHVANGLHRGGLRVEMVVLDDRGPVKNLLDPEIDVVGIESKDSKRRGERTMASVPAIARYLRQRSPRVLHSPGNHTTGPAALAIAISLYRGAFVPKITNPLMSRRIKGWRRRWMRRAVYAWALRRAQVILVLSRAAIAEVTDLYPRLSNRVRVVHNPYVPEAMVQRAAERSPAHPPIILSVGRLKKQKDHAMLLRAAARLGDRPWRVRILGVGPKERQLRELADELGISDRVEFCGFVTDPTAEYLQATVLAVSSRWEGLPAIVLEAIACGCPVVSTRSSPGLVELLEQAGARPPVAVGDEEGFAAGLAAALDGSLPPVSNVVSLPYSIESSMAEHADVFRQLIGLPALARSSGAATLSAVEEAAAKRLLA
jgi:glycosyltransferase involved in cell wall biosynthesis